MNGAVIAASKMFSMAMGGAFGIILLVVVAFAIGYFIGRMYVEKETK